MSDKKQKIPEYNDPHHYLLEQLRLLDLRLLRELIITNSYKPISSNNKGLFITDTEIMSLLMVGSEKNTIEQPNPEIESLDSKRIELENWITQRLSQTQFLPIFKLQTIFGLKDIEIDIIIMAIAPELDNKYERIYAYFNNDISKKAPSIELTFKLLSDDGEYHWDHYTLFSKEAPLLFFNLIHWTDFHPEEGFLSQRYQLNNGIRDFLLGEGHINYDISHLARFYGTQGEPESLRFHPDLVTKVLSIIENSFLNLGTSILWLYAKGHDLKKALILATSNHYHKPIIMVNLEDILYQSNPYEILPWLFRDAILYDALLFFKGGDFLYGSTEKETGLKMAFMKTLQDLANFKGLNRILFINANHPWMPTESDIAMQWYPLEIRLPDYAFRNQVWTQALQDTALPETAINTLSWRYNFSEAQILQAVNYARNLYGEGQITLDSLYQGCNLKPFSSLNKYASKITAHYQWDDLVLPDDPLMHLQDIAHFIINRHIVYSQWGFEKKLSLSRSVNILFSGPSGTGKTMSASIIANEIQLELYRVNLSTIVSKYIGETEKNLEQIFDDANAGNVILFFDEADALFGKRSEVKDAHDRYANIEVNYLLQKMEVHEGIVILATNLNKNIDEAFLRRMHFAVEFPFPDATRRKRLWHQIFPNPVPLANDIDYQLLGEKLQVSGGNIKNIALTAAFYGARDSSEVTMAHIIKAAEKEYHKMGKTFIKADFI